MRKAFFSIALATMLAALWPGDAGSAEQGFRKPGERDKCPVCGMFVAKYPDWTAEVLFKNGAYAVFDGPKDLFKFLADMKQYGQGRGAQDISAVYVTDYYTLKQIDGRSAYFVIGSDILGPMGRELIPFEREADARGFLKDHKGKAALKFGDVTPEVLRSLD